MANFQIYKFLSEKKFPIRDKFISFRDNFNKNVKKRTIFLNNHFSVLLKKDKTQQQISDLIKRHNLMVKTIEDQKQKKRKLQLHKKLKKILNLQNMQSSYNNKMLLDLMFKNTKFKNYLKSQNSKEINISNISKENNNHIILSADSSVLKKRNFSSPFLTDIKPINNNRYKDSDKKSLNIIKNKKDNFLYRIKAQKLKNVKSYKKFRPMSLEIANEYNNYYYLKKRKSKNKNFFSI